jgi:hypothetical protein
MLAKLLREEPSEEVIDAVSSIADEECMVQLGRIARTSPGLSDAALNALEDIDQPRAIAIATAVRWKCASDLLHRHRLQPKASGLRGWPRLAFRW